MVPVDSVGPVVDLRFDPCAGGQRALLLHVRPDEEGWCFNI